MSICATIGCPVIVDMDACIHDGFVFFDNLTKEVDPEYLCYLLERESARFSGQGQKGTQANLNTSIVKRALLLLPPRAEQQGIVKIIASVDDAVERTRAVIDQTRKLKTAMLQDLLTNGLPGRHKQRKTVKHFGTIPKVWTVRQLGDLVPAHHKITYGIVQAGPHIEDGVPYIRVSDMQGRQLTLDGMLRTSAEIASAYRRSEVSPGDIVFALRGDIGCVLPVPPELDGANLTQGTARISPGPDIDGQYLLWAIRSEKVVDLMLRYAKGSTFKEISLDALAKLKVPVPEADEQEAIGGALDVVESRIWADEDYLCQLLNLKRALSQALLTGRIPVPMKGGE